MPELLYPGDKVAILATSGPVDQEKLAFGIDIVRGMGLVPVVMESCYLRHDYLAGTDDIRLRDLHIAFAAEDVRGIFVARGGYGAGRLLPYLDYELIGRNPKVFVGYSDVTALHIAFNQRCGFVTFHGPMVAVDFGRCDVTMESLISATCIQPPPPTAAPPSKEGGFFSPLPCIVPGYTSAPLIGGNLSLLTASLGTPYEIDTRGRILFIEEIGEEPYRIDRMFLQLKQAGKLTDASGILLGDFAPQTLETLHICINELIIPAGKPTLSGQQSGHCLPNLTLPLGMTFELNAV